MRSFSVPDRMVGWALPILAILAEGALLAVGYVAIEVVIDGRVPLLGTLELAAAAGLAATAVRRRWIDPDAAPIGFLLLLAGLGLTGWLWSAEARELVLAGNPVDALAHHPGGWLMVVAGMRGVGRAWEVDDRAVTRLVLGGLPALAIPWAFGQLTGPVDLRPVFTDHAFVASLTFVTTGFIAAGLARLQEIGRETGVDWRRDRSWSGTVVGVLAAVLVVGVPASVLLGLPGSAVARGILDPALTIVGYIFIGFATLAALAAAIIASAVRLTGFELPMPSAQELGGQAITDTYTLEEVRGALTGLGFLWIVLLVVTVVLVRVWLRRRSPRVRGGPSDERRIQLPQRARRMRPAVAAGIARRGPVRVHDAVTAYLAALGDLAARDGTLGRAEHETPRAHARRADLGTDLDALQADYALARYGGRRLTPGEDRRAIRRWRRLRSRPQGPADHGSTLGA